MKKESRPGSCILKKTKKEFLRVISWGRSGGEQVTKRIIKIELDHEDTETLPMRQNVVKTLVKGIIDMVHKISRDLEDNEQDGVDTGEVGVAFAYAIENIANFITLDELDSIVMHEDEDDIEGDADIAKDFVEALGGTEVVESRKASVEI